MLLEGNEKRVIRVGCQAWTYDDWKTKRGTAPLLYPEKTRPGEYLSLYAKVFDTVEVNTTFYAIPKLSMVEGWYRQTPPHFKFSLKMPKVITHEHKLRNSSQPILEEFFAHIAPLKEKLSVILIQMPGEFKPNELSRENLENFLASLPTGPRYAIEFRSAEWLTPEIFDLLKTHRIAPVLGESEFLSRDEIMPALSAPQTDLMYLRFRGKKDLLNYDRIQRPRNEAMNFWFEQVMKTGAKEVFVFFSNLFEGNSPLSAMNFRRMLGQKFLDPAELEPNRSLF